MKKIHILPTDKPSRIYLIKSNNKLGITSNNPEFTENFGGGTQNQNIYITSDEEIKEKRLRFIMDNREGMCGLIHQVSVVLDSKICPEIILTDNKDLIKDGVQAIDDKFLEWFVKNPSCERVKIERGKLQIDDDGQEYGFPDMSKYKIIIPKEEPKTNLERLSFLELVEEFAEYYKKVRLIEEPKPHSFCETPDEKCTMNYCDENGCQNRKRELVEPQEEPNPFELPKALPDDVFFKSLEEPKQETLTYSEAAKKEERIFNSNVLIKETLEEASEKYSREVWGPYYIHSDPAITLTLGELSVKDFSSGAKWQAERMYSEKDMIEFTQTMIMQYKFGNTNIEQLDLLKESLEQYYNETYNDNK
jgi:hypothetical protein